MITIAKKCVFFNDFNTSFAITSSLGCSSIDRLKKTWKSVPHRYLIMLTELSEVFGVETNYFPYKKLLQSKEPPIVPYLGVFLRDLTFIEVGNPTYHEGKIVNYEKFRMIAAVFNEFTSFQKDKYDFVENRQLQTIFRFSIEPMEEDHLFALSLKLEPKVGIVC